MKKKFILTFSVLTLILALPSCKKYLDINTNPNAAVTVDPKLLFSYAVTSYVDLRASGDLWIPTSLAGQAVMDGFSNPTGWSGGGLDEGEYKIDPLIYGNPWRAYYTSIGNNLKQAIKIAESATPKNNNAAAQCKVILALVYYELTTLYGDVPYTEAFNSDIAYPHFDPQQKVLLGVVATLDEALAQFDPASTVKISDYDLFYKGDIAKWKRLATSLKLRTLMTMVDKDPTQAAKIGAMINAGGLVASAADNFQVPFQDIQNKKNPKYFISEQFNGKQNFFFASKWVTNYLDPVNDPRLPKLFDLPAGQTHYIGIEQGADGDDAINPRVSTSLQTATEPETIFDYQDELFYEAEIYARGIGVAVDIVKANLLYKQAVLESCKFYGVATATATAFSASLPTYIATDLIYNIQYQHWVDLTDRGIDAFTQWRRSGPEGSEIPALTIPIGAPANGLFRRYEYPITNEINQNPNAPKAVVHYYEKQWFDL
ncbi:SusD/RagB family nutrient-binding outer membrane lipoprotein [Mucilaginibacter sp. UR6-11]|uniref:SusD/RagB family nutrient-binding outer membrane lipoprotein n=1 Tax=Mucilaginibacter sp. UR6-11 TaxID=1435644 RepID=UPI001E51C8E4|nr:SusD/RagB family nutrient-binding outer membrane lipoprotein [Mucilaginibacter sp. UR6-11]MCC8424399.1 SusD/RagB family nutrient-binding outer membrane lipoprotein [Mucilaginibacter sp. UR6-11]